MLIERFSLISVESNSQIALPEYALLLSAFYHYLRIRKIQNHDSLTHHFPRIAKAKLEFLISFNWLDGLSASFVIDRSDNFGFILTTLS